MPEDAARKKRTRALADIKGIAYTAAMRLLADNPNPLPLLDRQLRPGEATAMFGRPVGIITRPTLADPVVMGSWGIGGRLREIRLGYFGPARLPDAYMLTNLPLKGEEPETDVLVTALHNFIAAHDRTSPDRHEMITEALRASREAPRESVDISLGGKPTAAIRVRVATFEALEIPHQDGCIVYCGLREHSEHLRLDLDQPV